MIKKQISKRGFTIVELMIALLVSSILILTAGIMLYYGWRAWHRNSVKMALQGDAIYAMDVLDRAIRPANNAYLEIINAGSELKQSNKNFLRFYGSNLERYSATSSSYQPILKNIKPASGLFKSVRPVNITMTLQSQISNDNMDYIKLDFVAGSRN